MIIDVGTRVKAGIRVFYDVASGNAVSKYSSSMPTDGYPMILQKSGDIHYRDFSDYNGAKYFDITHRGMKCPYVAFKNTPFLAQVPMGTPGNAWVRVYAKKDEWFDGKYYMFDIATPSASNCGMQIFEPETGRLIIDSSWTNMVPVWNLTGRTKTADQYNLKDTDKSSGWYFDGSEAVGCICNEISEVNGITHITGVKMSGDAVLVSRISTGVEAISRVNSFVGLQYLGVRTKNLPDYYEAW